MTLQLKVWFGRMRNGREWRQDQAWMGAGRDGRPGALGPCALVVASPGRAVHRGAINCAKRAILRVEEWGWEWIRG